MVLAVAQRKSLQLPLTACNFGVCNSDLYRTAPAGYDQTLHCARSKQDHREAEVGGMNIFCA